MSRAQLWHSTTKQVLIVQRHSKSIYKNCAFCDGSMKHIRYVNIALLNAFRYGANWFSTSKHSYKHYYNDNHTWPIKILSKIMNINKIRSIYLYAKERLVDRSKSLNDAIRCTKLPLFFATRTKTALKSKQQVAYAKNVSELFSRLYIACQTRDGNLDEFFKHENRAHPPSFSRNGQLHFGTKANLLESLGQLVEWKVDAPQTTSLILDGAAIVQMLKPNHCKTFMEYTTNEFIPYIMSQLQHHSCLDRVWDHYAKSGCLKATARANCGKGICRRVNATASSSNQGIGIISSALMTTKRNYLTLCPHRSLSL